MTQNEKASNIEQISCGIQHENKQCKTNQRWLYTSARVF